MAASGKYMTLVDADDTIHAGMIESMLDIAQREEADLVSCRISRSGSRAVTDCKAATTHIRSGQAILKEFLENKTDQSACARLYDVDLLKDVRFDTAIKINEDKLYIYGIFSRAKRHVDTEMPLYNYHQVKDSVSHSEFSEKFFDIERVADLIFGDVARRFPHMKPYANVQLIRSLMELYTHMTLSGDARRRFGPDYRRLRGRLTKMGFQRLDTRLATLRLLVITHASALYLPLSLIYDRIFRRQGP